MISKLINVILLLDMVLSAWLHYYQTMTRPATSLGHQGGESFLRVAQIFELCPILLNYVQHIFPKEAKNFIGDLRPPPPPWLLA